jgi:ATP-binding cassette subfamily B protein/subfamily B ATP-binding cassette protein MsbA
VSVLHGSLSPGELLVAMGYVAALYAPLEQISNTVSGLQMQFITLRGALRLLDTDPEIHERPGAVAIGRARGHIAFDRVSFSYVARRGTLEDVTFEAEPGMRVAIVGPTGAGKSTLLSMIPRFYDAQRGRVLLDGRDVRDYTIDSLRAQVSVVLQEPLLFSGTLEDNIRYGDLCADEERLLEASVAANAHDFIQRLPHAYGTMIGERGARLSGGERQRISVARAFLRDAPILILDEPTSSVDSRTEAGILEALERLMVGRTTFIVSHRLSTITGADLILVVDDGRVVEQGNHEDLLVLDGLYAQLHAAQNGAGRSRASAGVSAEGLSELTTAIVESRRDGQGISGPALAELAQAMSARAGDRDDAWQLLAAVWPLLRDGSPGPLQELAARNGHGGDASRMAGHLLDDLGLSPQPQEDAA